MTLSSCWLNVTLEVS